MCYYCTGSIYPSPYLLTAELDPPNPVHAVCCFFAENKICAPANINAALAVVKTKSKTCLIAVFTWFYDRAVSYRICYVPGIEDPWISRVKMSWETVDFHSTFTAYNFSIFQMDYYAVFVTDSR